MRLDVRDVLAFVGLTLITIGVGLVSIAGSLVVLGVLLFALAVVPPLLARRGGG